MKLRIAIVVQRWYPDVVGGAETLAGQYAQLLGELEETEVDLLTTVARDSRTWNEDPLPAGIQEEPAFRVQRFALTNGRTPAWQALHTLLVQKHAASGGNGGSGGGGGSAAIEWPIALQEEWIRSQGPHSQDLIDYVRQEAPSYDLFFFVTYLYSPSYFGLQALQDTPVIFVPALHDEPPAYLPAFRWCARRADRIFWNAEGEAELGGRLWGQLSGRVVAMAIDEPPKQMPSQSESPFLLYCGRMEPGKGVAELTAMFLALREQLESPLRLILIGRSSPDLKIPAGGGIELRGFVSEEEKSRLMSQARALVMPSPLESLSIVVLEAMLRGTPALVLGKNPVLAGHIRRSGAGLCYDSQSEFNAAVRRLLPDSPERQAFSEKGRAYVRENYSRARIKQVLREEVHNLVRTDK